MSKEIPFYIEKYIEFIFAQRNLSKNTILSYENTDFLRNMFF